MASNTILVTGGAGYIGSHACKALAAAGYEPVTYDNLCRGHRSCVKWGPFEDGDILDADRLRAVVEKHKPDAVMHFAALALVGESFDQPDKYHRNNVTGTATLMSVACNAGIRKVVFSGSCAVYGIPDVTPIVENAPLKPINPYGENKLAAEKILSEAETSHGLAWVSLRYFNAAGADPDLETGEKHDPETHIIPNVLKVAAGLEQSVQLHGDDYPTPDGTCIRDYVHVCDIADAHVRALKNLATNNGGHTYNIGTGTGYSVRQVIDAARHVTGRDIRVEAGPRREGDPAILVADAGKIHKDLHWTPRRSALDVQIADAWAWHQKSGF